MKTTLILTLMCATWLTAPFAFGQACGQSTCEISIFTLNGSEKLDFEYEIIPVNEAQLDTLFYRHGGTEIHHRIYMGMRVTPQQANLLVPVSDEEKKRFSEMKNHTKNKTKGKVKDSKVVFNTLELLSDVFLLKVTSGDTTFYAVGAFWGGCDKTLSVLWGAYPQLSR